MFRADSRQKTAAETSTLRAGMIAGAFVSIAASVVALWPYTAVIVPGPWSTVTVALLIVVVATGLILRTALAYRSAGLRLGVTAGAQLVLGTATLTAAVSSQGALLGVIPTGVTIDSFLHRAITALDEVQNGVAPLADAVALRSWLCLCFLLAVILIDQLVAHRQALLTAIVLIVVGAIPTVITLSDANVVWFIALALVILILFRHSLVRSTTATAARNAPILLTAGLATVTIALPVFVAPLLPVSATWAGSGAALTIDPSLRLGDDLRRPNPAEVLTLATDASTAPYLRMATLSRFDGTVWHPDETTLQPLASGFGLPEWGPEITTAEQATSVRVVGMSSSLLPIPYPAERVQGTGFGWRAMPLNRTVTTRSGDASGEDYTVTATVPTPTLEQMRATTASGAPNLWSSPDDLPTIIAEQAAEVTAGQPTDYDRMLALQNWFRSDFEYSLDTPVEEDFDGTGAEAVAAFLSARSGYCIHFAGAFALMAQSLDMPVRIVVGYLPGTRTDEVRGDDPIYSVSSDQLHSWPEVHFEGIGWIPFEPTATLGVPTEFAPAAIEGSGSPGSTPTDPGAAPSAEPTSAPAPERDDVGGSTPESSELRSVDPSPVLLTIIGILVALLLPALARRIQSAVRLRRARGGDAIAAWAELRSTLVDLRLPVSEADSPRVRGARLVSDYRIDPGDSERLVSAIERFSYSSRSEASEDLSVALRQALTQLRRSQDRRSRAAAIFVPRSLIGQRTARAPVLS